MSRAVVVVVLASACYQRADYDPCELSCKVEPTCPSGLDCIEGFCAPPGTPPGACTTPFDGPDLTACPTGYGQLGNGRYRIVLDNTLTWIESAASCVADAGTAGPVFTHLVAITSLDELNLLREVTEDAWIGYFDYPHDGVWQHVTGESPMFPGEGGPGWAPDQPGGGPGEGCALIRAGDNNLDDRNCTQQLRRICECDGNLAQQIVPL